MLGVVRLLIGLLGVAGIVYLVRSVPPLLAARRNHVTRIGEATRYGAWRGGPGRGPDLLDRLEGELIAMRLRRLAGVAIATIAALLIALFAPSS